MGEEPRPGRRNRERRSRGGVGRARPGAPVRPQVVGGQPAFIVCNSVGGVAGLQASVDRCARQLLMTRRMRQITRARRRTCMTLPTGPATCTRCANQANGVRTRPIATASRVRARRPELVRGVQVLNVSLRGLHVQRTEPWKRPLVAWLQDTLRNTQLGQAFFGALAKPQVRARWVLCPRARRLLRACAGQLTMRSLAGARPRLACARPPLAKRSRVRAATSVDLRASTRCTASHDIRRLVPAARPPPGPRRRSRTCCGRRTTGARP